MKNTIGVIWVISGNRKIIPDHLATNVLNDIQILFEDLDLKLEMLSNTDSKLGGVVALF
jgi:hypothetical protein